MQLKGRYRIIVEGDTGKVGVGYDHKTIGYLFERLLTGQEAVMENLANLGIQVRLAPEHQDEFIAIKREVME